MNYSLNKIKEITENTEIYVHPSISEDEFTKCFGVPIEYCSLSKNKIPKILNICFQHINTFGLKEVGIFRISGNMLEMANYKKQFDLGIYSPFPPSTDPHIISGLIKLFLREMPYPLLTFEKYITYKNLFTKRKKIFSF
jgi:hypothetical protein